MCGRYAFFAPPHKLKDLFGTENNLNLPPRYNAAPGQDLPVIVHNRAGLARWGFGNMINARSETVSEKPLFREAWARHRRCLIPADGFYEWKDKQPYFIRTGGGEVFGMAGLWTKTGDTVAFIILTRAADGKMKDLHERMPVILRPDQAAAWFGADEADARAMMARVPDADLVFHPVGRDVGNAANDSAGLVNATYSSLPA